MNQKITKDKFKNMRFDPFVKTNGRYLWENYSEFGRRVEFSNTEAWKEGVEDDRIPESIKNHYHHWGKDHLNLILQFIIVVFDKESLLYDYPVDRRVKIAFDIVGLNKKAETQQQVREEIELDTDYYKLLVTQYFIMRNSIQYETWYSQKMNLHYLNEIARSKPSKNPSPSEINNRKSLQTQLGQMSDELMALEYQLFKDPKIAEILAEKASESGMAMWVEKMAKTKPWDEDSKKAQEDYEI